MLTSDVQLPLHFAMLLAEIVACVLFAQQGVVHLLMYRASRKPDLAWYAIWCFWSTLLPLTQIVPALRVSAEAKFLALHAMSVVVPLMLQSYLASVASFLRIDNRAVRTLVRVQPLMCLPPLLSALSYLLGGDPFYLVEPASLSSSPIVLLVQRECPRSAVHPACLAAAVVVIALDLAVLLRAAWRAPRRDGWVLFGIVLTCIAVAFEVVAFRIGWRFAVPAIFAANLVESLRITYVSIRRAAGESAMLEGEIERQRVVVARQLRALDATARLATLGELVSELSHEMRNPVASATLFIDAAKRRAGGEGRLAEPLEKAAAALGQLARLLAGVASYGRVEAEHTRGTTRLRSAIDDAAALCAHRLRGAQAELQIAVPEPLCAHASTTELVQIFVNLIANACDAIERVDGRWIRVSADEHEQTVTVRVADAGLRPPRAVADEMFFRPFTTKGDNGTGLGLRICKRIVDSLGGSIMLDGDAPTTTIVLELPGAHLEGAHG